MKTKNRIWIYPLFIIFALFLVTSSCKKDNNNSSSPSNTITDVDGNVYHFVVIGTQTWMVENLSTTHYNDGTPIPNVTNPAVRDTLKTAAYFWYNDDITNKAIYGALYNWYAVNTGILAPKGWHVASFDEWGILYTYLGGADAAGAHLKEQGAAHWGSTNISDNSSGFTALPGGESNGDGYFGDIGVYGWWWSATYSDDHDAFALMMSPGSTGINGGRWNTDVDGFSVRCVKN